MDDITIIIVVAIVAPCATATWRLRKQSSCHYQDVLDPLPGSQRFDYADCQVGRRPDVGRCFFDHEL
jgi:hypothetical protein